MTKTITPVIMSGGSGTRLWPVSRTQKPKQFHAFAGGGSLLAETVARVSSAEARRAGFAPPVLICSAAHAGTARAEAGEAGADLSALILEEQGRNTAPAAAFAAFHAAEADAEALVLLSPADHHMAAPAVFVAAVEKSAEAARAGRLVTFGIRPDAPETGYGYIRRGDGEAGDGVAAVEAFVEKPDHAAAQAYLADGSYFWNAGIFLFRADVLLDELKAHRPDIFAGAKKAYDAAARDGDTITLKAEDLADCPADSLDYAVMEKTANAAVMPVDPRWSDVGSWSAVWALSEKTGDGDALSGDVMGLDTSGCLIRSDGPMVAALGVEDLVIVATGDAVFVAPRARAQDVRKIVEALKNAGRPEADMLPAAISDALSKAPKR